MIAFACTTVRMSVGLGCQKRVRKRSVRASKMAPDGKIKAKDLSYESTLPPFLQELYDQNAGRGDQDRHERAIARPKRAKTNAEDDGPTVVDESGEMVSKEGLAMMTSNGNGETQEGGNGKTGPDDVVEPKASGAMHENDVQRADQKVTDGTAIKKRKVAKVVGVEDEEVHCKNGDREEDSATKKAAKKVRKKTKPIKLAFDDDDNET